MGDGRVAAVLAHFEPARPVYGIEWDPELCARAVENLAALRRWSRGYRAVRLVEGDYCDPATYASCGLDLRNPLVIVNYPDGNERRLEQFVVRHGAPGATLCLFTHDRSLDIDELPLHARRDVPVGVAAPWRCGRKPPARGNARICVRRGVGNAMSRRLRYRRSAPRCLWAVRSHFFVPATRRTDRARSATHPARTPRVPDLQGTYLSSDHAMERPPTRGR